MPSGPTSDHPRTHTQAAEPAAELTSAWQEAAESLARHLAALGADLGKAVELDLYSSHALGTRDRDLLASVLRALFAHVASAGIESPLVRQSQRKAKTAHVAVTVDYINGWFFVRVRDDGAHVKHDQVYAPNTALSSEITALHAIGGHFSIERTSARGTSYTLSWERSDAAIQELPADSTPRVVSAA